MRIICAPCDGPIVVVCVMVMLAPGATIEAQWLNYPTRGIPRLPDGKPDFSGIADGLRFQQYYDGKVMVLVNDGAHLLLVVHKDLLERRG